jgi:CRP-like cAMP-binding protein
MPLTTNSPNHFLKSLSASDRDLIFPHLRPVMLASETIVFKAEGPIERIYFPHAGIVSVIVGLSTGQFVEAGMLGRNGVVGAGAALDGQTALNTAIIQADSAAAAPSTASAVIGPMVTNAILRNIYDRYCARPHVTPLLVHVDVLCKSHRQRSANCHSSITRTLDHG